MKETTWIVDVGQSLYADNQERAAALRGGLSRRGVLMVDLMGSPGSGKTSLLLETLRRLPVGLRVAVIEGDLDSTVDADAVREAGWNSVQIRTGGFCHLDAAMVSSALERLGFGPLEGPATPSDAPDAAPSPYDLIFVENIGNLVCTGQSDVGAHLRVALLSRPEGDDKPVKYPIMFRNADVLVLTKADYDAVAGPGGPVAPFDAEEVRARVGQLNPAIQVFQTSCRTGEGIDEWAAYLAGRVAVSRGAPPDTAE